MLRCNAKKNGAAGSWDQRCGLGLLAAEKDAADDRSCVLSPQFHFNPAQSILVMEGEDLDNMNAAVRKVSYINSRQFPTPGARRLRISTSVQYVNTPQVPPSEALNTSQARRSSSSSSPSFSRFSASYLTLCSTAVACSFNKPSSLPRCHRGLVFTFSCHVLIILLGYCQRNEKNDFFFFFKIR